jgi:hypothetical protein
MGTVYKATGLGDVTSGFFRLTLVLLLLCPPAPMEDRRLSSHDSVNSHRVALLDQVSPPSPVLSFLRFGD